jgi:dihydroneopterin aldolase
MRSQMPPKISIIDLEVFYHVGVPDTERAAPQRLLLTVEMDFDFSCAARTDDLAGTIDYFAVSRRLLSLGQGRNWKLIETVAADIADAILTGFKPAAVRVEVKKFILPEARYVSVTLGKRLRETPPE